MPNFQKETKKSQKTKKQKLYNYAKYSGITFQMLVTIGLGVWGGIELDKLLSLSFPLFTVILSLLGVGASLYLALKDITRMK